MGFGLSGGAAGAAGALQELLRQKFYEQLQMSRLAEDARQADMQNAAAMGGLDLRGRALAQDASQFETTSGQAQQRIDLDKAEQPVKLRYMGAQSDNLARQPEKEAAERAHDFELAGMQGGQRLQQIEAQNAGDLREASVRSRGAGGAGGLSPTQQIIQTRMLRNEYQRATGSARELRRQQGLMEQGLTAAKAGNLNAGSQAVLVTFQKILDPNSVVRESEYARSTEGLGVLQRMQGILPRLQQGGPGVPVAELEQFAALARQMVDGVNAAADEQARGVRDIASAYGLDPDLVAPLSQGAAPTAAPGQAPAAAPAARSAKDLINQYRRK